MTIRVGIGYDVHPLAQGHPLVLGGVAIPYERGLVGWSDGDVLVHAIMDVLLGAAALGDIGSHFPPGDPRYQGISSLELLKRVGRLIRDGGWRVGNIDATIVAEQPRLAAHFNAMRQNMARALGIDPSYIGLKATTSEGLGFVGRGEGIAVWAVALIEGETPAEISR